MYLPITKIIVYSKNPDTGNLDTTGREITGFNDVDVRVGVETIKDVFSFTIPNTYVRDTNTWNRPLGKKIQSQNFIKIGDFVKISAYYTSPDSTESNNILIYGEVTNFSYNNGEEDGLITVNGANLSENLLRGYAIGTYDRTSSTNTASAILLDLINRRIRFGGIPASKKIYCALEGQYITDTIPGFAAAQNITGTTGHIRQTTKQITYSKFWQPAYRILEDLSTPENTGDEDSGTYIFYIQAVPVLPQFISYLKTNYIYELVWGPVSQNITTATSLSRGTDYSTINTTKNVDDVINVLIVKPGVDCNGAGMIDYAANNESVNKVGPKFGLFAKPEIASKVRSDERAAGTQLGSTFTGDLPDTGQYPWTFKTIRVRNTSQPFAETSTAETASDQDEYNTVIRDESIYRGKIEAQRIVDALGEPIYTTNVDMLLGSNNIGMGVLINLSDKTFGWDGTTTNPVYRLRVRDIRHRISDNGWDTTLVCKEDEKVISDRINR